MSDDCSRLYPWLLPTWAKVASAVQRDRLSHAVLLEGSEGVGKYEFSLCLADVLLKPAGDTLQHPQVLKHCLKSPDFIQFGHNSELLTMASVRDLIAFMQQPAYVSSCRVVLIESIESLHASCINALLKLIEEPVNRAYFILLTEDKASCLSTIVSRCQHFDFVIDAEVTKSWLVQHRVSHGKSTAHVDLCVALYQWSPKLHLQYEAHEVLALYKSIVDALTAQRALMSLDITKVPLQLFIRVYGQLLIDLLGYQQRDQCQPEYLNAQLWLDQWLALGQRDDLWQHYKRWLWFRSMRHFPAQMSTKYSIDYLLLPWEVTHAC